MSVEAVLRLQIAEFNRNYKAATRTAQKESEEMRRAASGAGIGLEAAFRRALPALSAYEIMQRAVRIGLDAISTSMERQRMEMGLAAVSSDHLGSQLDRLRELAESPGLGFDQSVSGSTKLQAVGFSAQFAEKTLLEMGNALALVGGGREQMDGVILALTQIAAKGKVSAEEINQIAERLPQIRGLMRDAFGTADTEELQKMGIGAEEFVMKVVGAMEKLPRAVSNSSAELDNLKDDWKAVLDSMGDMVEPALSPAFRLFSAHLNNLESNFRSIKQYVTGDYSANAETPQDVVEVTEADKAMQLEQARFAAESAKKEKEAAEERKKKLDELGKIKDDLEDKDIQLMPDEEKLAALKEKLKRTLDETVGMFGLNFEVSLEGLRALAAEREGRAELPLEGQGSAEEVYGWIKKAEALDRERAKTEAKILEDRKRASEAEASRMEELEKLRADAWRGDLARQSPEEQMRRMREQLSGSLAIDIAGAADIERGLGLMRMEVESARRSGDVEGEKAALERLNEGQRQASEFRRAASSLQGAAVGQGEFQTLVDQIFNRDPQAEQLQALHDAAREQRESRELLDQILKRMGDPPPRDVFSDYGNL